MKLIRIALIALALLALAAPALARPAKPAANTKPAVTATKPTAKPAGKPSAKPNSRSNSRSAANAKPAPTPAPLAVKIPENMTSQQMREQLIQTAYSQLGLSYMMGGTTPQDGFDCSGYMRWVFSMVDITLPRTSGEQFGNGVSIDKTQLVPGDLVLFRNGRRIGHVGLYVGQDYFIHSPNKRSEIMISKLSAPGWGNTYVGARRIVPDNN